MTAIAQKVGNVWDRVVAGAVVANAGVVLLAGLLGLDERVLDVAEHAFLAFFCLEWAVRFRAAGWRLGAWGWFDLAVIVVALLPLGGGVLALRVARVARLARLLHLTKHVAVHLRHMRVRQLGVISSRR
ncbi:ion transporter [Mycolicibacterium rhodesiae]|uniref:Ion transport domain-containing protein n=1 Tax=Mycolicibacterium rhodesiae TaxID=36814 RepID=A0A1X0IJ51_MYCRH|nr:ion transporter [Mycolicibacterium rhodesiae]MCV7342974.1 ion transporter [Mycolicibacterium rhodesiae]ORB47771.1 hypothetical protein BST42_27060 [Mycolicibacterium rhodesiae]